MPRRATIAAAAADDASAAALRAALEARGVEVTDAPDAHVVLFWSFAADIAPAQEAEAARLVSVALSAHRRGKLVLVRAEGAALPTGLSDLGELRCELPLSPAAAASLAKQIVPRLAGGPRRRLHFVIGAVVLVCGLVGAAQFKTMADGSSEVARTADAARIAAQRAKEEARKTAEEAREGAKDSPVFLAVISEPPGVTVEVSWQGGAKSGQTPFELEVPKHARVRFKFSKGGYRQEILEVVADEAQVVKATLRAGTAQPQTDSRAEALRASAERRASLVRRMTAVEEQLLQPGRDDGDRRVLQEELGGLHVVYADELRQAAELVGARSKLPPPALLEQLRQELNDEGELVETGRAREAALEASLVRWQLAVGALAGLALAAASGIFWNRRRAAAPKSAAPEPAAPATSALDGAFFVSYARRDYERVEPIVRTIENLGHHVWLDQRRLSGEAAWTAQISEAISRSGGVVVVCSPAAFSSDYVVRELHLAMEEKKKLVALFIEQAELPLAVRFILAGAQRFQLDPAADLQATLQRALATA